jgi:hypothetical protein
MAAATDLRGLPGGHNARRAGFQSQARFREPENLFCGNDALLRTDGRGEQSSSRAVEQSSSVIYPKRLRSDHPPMRFARTLAKAGASQAPKRARLVSAMDCRSSATVLARVARTP